MSQLIGESVSQLVGGLVSQESVSRSVSVTSMYTVIVAYTRSPPGVTRLSRGELCNELSQAASNRNSCLQIIKNSLYFGHIDCEWSA